MRTVIAVFCTTLVLTACDITNPGPLQDEFLDESETHAGLIRGAERGLMIGAMRIFFASATVTREIFPGGDTNSHSPRLQAGALPSNEMDDYWNSTQQGRWVAEDALRRFAKDEVEASEESVAEASIVAGYASKLLGENFCRVVLDGGPDEDPTVALRRAEAHFSEALERAVTPEQRYAAYAGRAQTRVELGDWSGAVGDAAEVPTEFVYELETDPAFVETRNFIAFANLNENYRQFTYHFTYFFDDQGFGFGTGYYSETGDPRARWAVDPDFPVANASLPGFGNVPWSFRPDFPQDAPVALARGTEMRLYEAEDLLLSGGDVQEAVALINEVRAHYRSELNGLPLEPITAATAEEAGTHLKNERLVDGHLMGRRFLDLRRWSGRDATPGEAYWPDWGQLTPIFDDEPTATCFPIPDSERDINPNVS